MQGSGAGWAAGGGGGRGPPAAAASARKGVAESVEGRKEVSSFFLQSVTVIVGLGQVWQGIPVQPIRSTRALKIKVFFSTRYIRLRCMGRIE